MSAPEAASPRGTAMWWVLIAVLTVTAGEAEHVRRAAGPPPGVCIGSAVLLQGTTCPKPPSTQFAEPL